MMNSGRINFGFEPGYAVFSGIFAIHHVPFRVFYGIYVLIELFLIYSLFYKCCKNTVSVALLSFAIFPYLHYLDCLRSALGVAMILNVICNLKRSKASIAKFIAVVLFASLFQITNILYILLVIPVFLSMRNTIRMVFNIFVISSVFIGPFYRIAVVLLKKIPLFNRVIYNLSDRLSVGLTSRVSVILYMILFITLVEFWRFSKNRSESTEFWVKEAMIVTSFAVFVYVAAPAYRFSCMAMPIVYVAISKLAQDEKNGKKRIVYYSSSFIFALLIFVLYWGPQNERMYYMLTHVMWKVRPF